MGQLREVAASGRLDPERVAFVLISVDGERDSPERMKEFLARYSDRFIGLTAPSAEVKPLAKQFAASFYRTGGGENYDVAHSPQLFVLDPAGRLRAEVYGAPADSMHALAQALLDEDP